ncbi:hypothetical protein GGF32_007806 [Allomyces javanicus]|nr:hypothetical protein GGF32_007806 [Allomyces javanicus]
MEAKLQATIDSLTSQTQELRTQHSTVEQKLAQCTAEYRTLQESSLSKYNDLNDVLSQVQRDLLASRSTQASLEQKVADVETQYTAALRSLEDLKAEHKKVKQDSSTSIEAASVKLGSLQSKFKSQSARMQDLEKTRAMLTDDLTQCKTSRDALMAKVTELNDLQAAHSRLESEYRQVQDVKQTLENSLAELQLLYQSKTRDLDRLRALHDGLQASSATKAFEYEETVRDLKRLTGTVAQLQADLADSQTMVNDLRSAKERVSRDLQSNLAALQTLKTVHDQVLRDLADCKETKRILAADVNQLKADAAKAADANATLQKMLASKTAEASDLRVRLDKSTVDANQVVEHLQRAKDELERQCAESRKALTADLNRTASELTQAKDKLQSVTMALSRQSQDSGAAVSELEARVERLQQELAERSAAYKVLEQTLADQAEKVSRMTQTEHAGDYNMKLQTDLQYVTAAKAFNDITGKVTLLAERYPDMKHGTVGLCRVFEPLQFGRDVVLIGYGVSGSGKSYTLMGRKRGTSDVHIPGILQYMLANTPYSKVAVKAIFELGAGDNANLYEKTVRGEVKTLVGKYQDPNVLVKIGNTQFANHLKKNGRRKKDDPTADNDPGVQAISESLERMSIDNQSTNLIRKAETGITFEELVQLLDAVKAYREQNGSILATPNNPVSSRTHLFVQLAFTFGGKQATLTIADLAGQEDTADLTKCWSNDALQSLISTATHSPNRPRPLVLNRAAKAFDNYPPTQRNELIARLTSYDRNTVRKLLRQSVFVNESLLQLKFFLMERQTTRETATNFWKTLGQNSSESEYQYNKPVTMAPATGQDPVLMYTVMQHLAQGNAQFVLLAHVRQEPMYYSATYDTLQYVNAITGEPPKKPAAQ